MKMRFITALAAAIWCVTQIAGAEAQTTNHPQSAGRFVGERGNIPGASDVALTATIEQVVSSHSAGTPAGITLVVGSPRGPIHVSVGPYLRPDLQQSLVAGRQIQVVGRFDNSGNNYLMARQLILDGRTVTLRNNNGKLVRPRTQARTHSQSLQNGELQ
jgi:hypothetical protein